MGSRISITAGEITLDAELNDSVTAAAIWDALPISASGNTWGDEIYFRIPVFPVSQNPDGLREVVDFGDLAFWPPGNAFCIFFGPTPASRGDEIRPASPVAIVGRITGDAAQLKQVPAGAAVPSRTQPYPLRGIERN